jgi:hypothetical protein
VYEPGQPGAEPGADKPTHVHGPEHSGNGNGQATHDSGQTAPAAWYPTEPPDQQPETGPVQIVGEPPVDTPPTGQLRVDRPHGDEAPESRESQDERGDHESSEDEDRPGPSNGPA